MNRCIAVGRLPASCTVNALPGGFSQMVTSVLPSVTDSSKPPAGLVMSGMYQGAGDWLSSAKSHLRLGGGSFEGVFM